MSTELWALSDDLPSWAIVLVIVSALASIGMLLVELRQRERLGPMIAVSGTAAVVLLVLAVLRPVSISIRGSLVGPRVVVLVDQSRRLLLPAEDGRPRRQHAEAAFAEIRRRFSDARLAVLGFDEGDPHPLALEEGDSPPRPAASASGASPPLGGRPRRSSGQSDLVAAIDGLGREAAERPRAVVVISDGRLTRPAPDGDVAAYREAVGALKVPVHTVAVASVAPPDASIRSVQTAGAAVAHQPFSLKLEVGCSGGLGCGRVPVTVRELRQGVEPAVLASGAAEVVDGLAMLELRITLERGGARVVEIAIDAPDGDRVPENDRRILAFDVARERVRLLHVAGRPTYDVRALRTWLKSDESVDLVAFFILRDKDDDPLADESELSLIPFPVDELFTQHLASFDAVMLQDIDAVEYKIALYLPALASYVEAGGGLIMVGGQYSFIGGGYAGTALERVLPVALPESAKPYDTVEFVPGFTQAGRVAPVLHALRQLHGEELPAMPGANTLGAPRKGSIVLLEHPRLGSGSGNMPVLAVGEAGDGRSIALGVDGTHLFAFGELAAQAGGRGFGALWDGLLGWLMRDPRYEAARVEVVGGCVAGAPMTLRLTRVPGMEGDVQVVLERLGVSELEPITREVKAPPPGPVEIDVGPLAPGGYTVRASIGAAPPTRHDFACELGGEAWSDSRPDPERLARIAQATDGEAVTETELGSLPLPPATRVAAERHVVPILPAWAWALGAALALGVHWIARRRGGLA